MNTLVPLQKKRSFPLSISSVNVTKSAIVLRIWSHLLKKFLMENFIFCAMFVVFRNCKKYSILNFSDLQVVNHNTPKADEYNAPSLISTCSYYTHTSESPSFGPHPYPLKLKKLPFLIS